MSALLRRLNSSLVVLALALCLPQGSLILCTGESGHVALEAACGTGPAEAHAETPAAGALEACDCDSGCGPCQDSPVGTELTASRARAGGHEVVLLPVLPAPAGIAATLPRPHAPSRHAAPAAPPDPFARIQAGVCLRI